MVTVGLCSLLVVSPLKIILILMLTLLLCVSIPLRKIVQTSSLSTLYYTPILTRTPPPSDQMVLDLSPPMLTLQTLQTLVIAALRIIFHFEMSLYLLNLTPHYLLLLIILLTLLIPHNLSFALMLGLPLKTHIVSYFLILTLLVNIHLLMIPPL